MVLHGLHAFRGAPRLIVLLPLCAVATGCGPTEAQTSMETAAADAEVTTEPSIDYSQCDVSRVGMFWVVLPLENSRSSSQHVITYDPEVNGFVTSLSIVEPIERPFSSPHFFSHPGFYVVANKLTIDYSDLIASNMAIPIFTTGDYYVSVRRARRCEPYRRLQLQSGRAGRRVEGVLHRSRPGRRHLGGGPLCRRRAGDYRAAARRECVVACSSR